MLKEIFNRYNILVATKNNKETICRKISAEFNATAYQNKNDVWVSYADDTGVRRIQKLGH